MGIRLKSLFSQIIFKNKKMSALPALEDVEEPRQRTQGQPLSPPVPIYVKAMLLRNLVDVELVKDEIKSGNVVILRITAMAMKNADDAKEAVNELCKFVSGVGGDIARLGEERLVVTPPTVKIWRRAS